MSPQPLDYEGPARRAERPRCSACGSDRTVEGRLGGADVGFRPHTLRKFLTLTAMVKVAAVACCACGALRLHVDPAALVDLAGDPAPADAPPT